MSAVTALGFRVNTVTDVFVTGWRHALRSEWPFIIIIIIITVTDMTKSTLLGASPLGRVALAKNSGRSA